MIKNIKKEIIESIEVKQKLLENEHLINLISKISEQCIETYRNGNKLILAGNGGSASESQHFSAELVGRLNYDRPSLPAISLNANTSAITAISNDYGFEYIFSRQLESLGNKGDVFIGITTSGNSKNIIKALEICNKKEIESIIFNGKDGGYIEKHNLTKYNIIVPSNDTKRIQEVHTLITHILCSIIESEIFSRKWKQ